MGILIHGAKIKRLIDCTTWGRKKTYRRALQTSKLVTKRERNKSQTIIIEGPQIRHRDLSLYLFLYFFFCPVSFAH